MFDDGVSMSQRAMQQSQFPTGEVHGKLYLDPIHELIHLTQLELKFIDTPYFQRLRRLKQLGVTSRVFAGAVHTRFDHSVGVGYLAQQYALGLQQVQGAELDMDRFDVTTVNIAGLCHDLGHGPFSHVFERGFLQRKDIKDWRHEDMSCKMFDAILDHEGFPDGAISEDQAKHIKRMICHSPDQKLTGDKKFLFDIVANGRNGIDVDKFDYLARDSHFCGVKLAADSKRLMKLSKVVGDEICYKRSEYETIHGLFEARASMHRRVYTHRKCRAIELMVVDMMLEADPVFRFSDAIHDADRFLTLTDSVEDLVRCAGAFGPRWWDDDMDHCITRAQAILRRLDNRDLYKYCGEAPVPRHELGEHWRPPSKEDIVACYSGNVKLREEDLMLSENRIDFSRGAQNPLDHVRFFDDFGSETSQPMRQEQVSTLLNTTFQEWKLRVYSRNSDPEYVAAVEEAFQAWVHRRFRGQVVPNTPAKRKRPRDECNGDNPAAADL